MFEARLTTRQHNPATHNPATNLSDRLGLVMGARHRTHLRDRAHPGFPRKIFRYEKSRKGDEFQETLAFPV